MSGFDSSDEESGDLDLTQFPIWWLNSPTHAIGAETLAISGLPGCRFKDTWRSLKHDLESWNLPLANSKTLEDCVKKAGIKDVFVLCERGELNKYRVPTLLHDMETSGLTVHHHPFPDGEVPSFETLLPVLQRISLNLTHGTKTLVHCFGGLGRSAVVAACLLMMLDSHVTTADAAIECLRQLRGPGAIQSVKQYNFLQDFLKNTTAHCRAANISPASLRPISR